MIPIIVGRISIKDEVLNIENNSTRPEIEIGTIHRHALRVQNRFHLLIAAEVVAVGKAAHSVRVGVEVNANFKAALLEIVHNQGLDSKDFGVEVWLWVVIKAVQVLTLRV